MMYGRQTAFLKPCLILWLLTATTAPAVCHAHAGGENCHLHGLGMIGAGRSTPAESGSPAAPCRHFHLLFFGLEIYLPSGDAAAPANGCLASSCNLSNSDNNNPTSPTIDSAAQHLDALPLTALTDSTGSAISPSLSRRLHDSCERSTCDLARGARSGVQQV
jgi:hypothetical protein